MKRGCVIGYDINEKGCQISYYDDSMEEPDTMMASSNNYLIPLVLAAMYWALCATWHVTV